MPRVVAFGTRDSNLLRKAMEEYKQGKDRQTVIRSLRNVHDMPEDAEKLFFTDRKSGEAIVLPTLVGPNIDICCVSDCLCDPDWSTIVLMFVLDFEVVIFLAHETTDDNSPTLVLKCDRVHIEHAAWDDIHDEEEDRTKVIYQDEDQAGARARRAASRIARAAAAEAMSGGNDGDGGDVDNAKEDDGIRWIPLVFPTEVDEIYGGTGFHIERVAGYMQSFEPCKDGLWNGQQVVAASFFLSVDTIYDPEVICFDPRAREDDDGVAYLPLASTVDARGETQGPNESEVTASLQYVKTILTAYKSIDLRALPRPGALRHRAARQPHVALRALVDRTRASPAAPPLRWTRSSDLLLLTKFVYATCADDIFKVMVRFF